MHHLESAMTRKQYWQKTWNFLISPQFKEFLVFAFFLLVSASFWLLQTLNESFELTVSVPLELKDVPKNVMITTELPTEVSVVVRDRGTSLFQYFRHRQLSPIQLEFSHYDNGSTSSRVQVSLLEVQRAIQSQLEASTKVQSIHPDTLEFYYNRGLRYRLPVRVLGNIDVAPQNYLIGVQCEPDSVDVYAPTSILDTMQYAYTQPVELTGLTSSVTSSVKMPVKPGVKFQPSSIDFTARIDYYTEKTVQVPIISSNFPAEKQLRTFPATVQVTFRVGAAQFSQVTAESFVLSVTYEELLRNESDKYRLHLKSIPDGVSNVRISPAEVDYLIEQSIKEEDVNE